MASFNSIVGLWFPAKEKAVHRETGDIYEGEDREAVRFIAQEKGLTVEEVIEQKAYIGTPVSEDPQIIELARNRNMSVEDYLDKNKPTPQQVKIQKDAQTKTVTHQAPPKHEEVDHGTDGGFYHPELKETAESKFIEKKGKK